MSHFDEERQFPEVAVKVDARKCSWAWLVGLVHEEGDQCTLDGSDDGGRVHLVSHDLAAGGSFRDHWYCSMHYLLHYDAANIHRGVVTGWDDGRS